MKKRDLKVPTWKLTSTNDGNVYGQVNGATTTTKTKKSSQHTTNKVSNNKKIYVE